MPICYNLVIEPTAILLFIDINILPCGSETALTLYITLILLIL